MQPKNEEQLTSIRIPQHKAYVHMANRIILARISLRGDESEIEIDDWTIQTAPKWFKPDRLKPLCSGLEKSYRIESITVYPTKLALRVIECLEESSAASELVIVPKIAEARFMLALYLAKVFDCLARIELYWRLNPRAGQNEFEVLLEDIDDSIMIANTHDNNLIELIPTDSTATKTPIKVSARTSKSSSSETSELAKSTAAESSSSKTTKAQPLSENSAKAIAEKDVTEIVQQLEHKRLLKKGKASTTKWNLMDCANYIEILSNITEDSARLREYIKYFYNEYRLPSLSVIKQYLGDGSVSWVRNARDWLKE